MCIENWLLFIYSAFKGGVTNKCLEKRLPKAILRVITPILMSESHRENGKTLQPSFRPFLYTEESHRENGKLNSLRRGNDSSTSNLIERTESCIGELCLESGRHKNLIERTERNLFLQFHFFHSDG